jgi:hypothetical protein
MALQHPEFQALNQFGRGSIKRIWSLFLSPALNRLSFQTPPRIEESLETM